MFVRFPIDELVVEDSARASCADDLPGSSGGIARAARKVETDLRTDISNYSLAAQHVPSRAAPHDTTLWSRVLLLTAASRAKSAVVSGGSVFRIANSFSNKRLEKKQNLTESA